MKLERIWKGILIVTLGFGPILFNPLMVDVFGFGKQTLLGVGLVLSLLFFGLSYLVKKQDHLVWGKMLSWGALMLIVGVLSWKGMDVGGRRRRSKD